MLDKNTNVNVSWPDGNTEFFDIVAGAMQEDILALYLFILNLDFVILRSIYLIKETGFTLKKS